MKIFSASQIKDIDSYTISHEPIRSIDLMERAAKKCADWIRRRTNAHQTIHLFCGMGNNGGDGLAMARMLAGTNRQTKVYKVRFTDHPTEDFLANEGRLAGVRNLHAIDLYAGDTFPEVREDDIVIDAIFGNGLNRPAEGFVAELIAHVNQAGSIVIAVDMPSGLFGDDNRENNPDAIIKADYTLTFQCPKLSFMFESNQSYIGEWLVLDIGLHPDAIGSTSTQHLFISETDIRSLYKPRPKFSHKGHFGHALLIAGSRGKMGAAILSARSCVRSGAGLLTVHAPSCGYDIIQLGVPEAMSSSDTDPNFISELPRLAGFKVIGMGPGIGTNGDTQRVLKRLIQDTSCPLVLDADALNILSMNPTWLDFLPPQSVLTPHPGEFERLVGKTTTDYDRFLKGKEFARRYNLILVLKGAHTVVISPTGACYFNSTGNPGMATGGSGDVLTGMIMGWLSQGYSSSDSSIMAVYLHGLAGDFAAKGKGYEGMVAGDLVEMLPRATKKALM